MTPTHSNVFLLRHIIFQQGLTVDMYFDLYRSLLAIISCQQHYYLQHMDCEYSMCITYS